MNEKLNTFFRPFAGKPAVDSKDSDDGASGYQWQFARELLLKALEAELAVRAGKAAGQYRPDAVKSVAHRLHNIVLRNPIPAEWAPFLQHEIGRKSGDAQKLLQDVANLLSPSADDVVGQAITTAGERARFSYTPRDAYPMQGKALAAFVAEIRAAAVRLYLANLLERLTL